MRNITLCVKKLNLQENHNYVNDSDFDESKMSEISVEDEIDFSSFVKHDEELKRNLIFEDSIKFEQFVEIKL